MSTLPSRFDKLYKSTFLKGKIGDIGMWSLIPGVDPNIDSIAGSRRMKENAPLFSFIDKYFPDGNYAFEPNMQDGLVRRRSFLVSLGVYRGENSVSN